MAHEQANPSTTQSNADFIPGIAGRWVKVTRIYVSSDTAMTVSLVNSATHDLVWRQYVGATGGSSAEYDYSSRVGEGLDLVTSTNGNVFIKVTFDYSGA